MKLIVVESVSLMATRRILAKRLDFVNVAKFPPMADSYCNYPHCLYDQQLTYSWLQVPSLFVIYEAKCQMS